MPAGDLTEIGTNGANLSGGQKSRINLARCVYKDADIYLFDDPISSVDSIVYNKILNQLIKNFLKDKTIIFASNTSMVEYMDGMFEFCDVFNCDISKWDVRKVETMSFMFHGAKKFNQPIGKWQTDSLTSMHHMFWFAEDFNQDIHKWNVNKVTNNKYAFVKSAIENKLKYQPNFKYSNLIC